MFIIPIRLINRNLFNKGLSYCRRQCSDVSSASVNISESCVQRLQQLCDQETFLRLSVEGGGCSGFQYKFDLDSKLAEDDKVFTKNGVKVVIDKTSLEYVNGATIDFHTELIRSAFRVVQNPNADIGCSCGASFSIKIDDK